MSKPSEESPKTEEPEMTAENNQDAQNENPVEPELEPNTADSVVSDEVQALTDEVAILKEQILRAQADMQNSRRRAEQDVEKARKFALEKFVSELLPVADNLERAIAAGNKEDETQKAVLEGVELTYKSLMDTLKKFNVEPVDPDGEAFNPELHQAMSMVPNPDVEPNTVLNVFQKGYTLYGRLVRPAMVVVSSAG